MIARFSSPLGWMEEDDDGDFIPLVQCVDCVGYTREGNKGPGDSRYCINLLLYVRPAFFCAHWTKRENDEL